MKGREERYIYEREREERYTCMKGREKRYIYEREKGEIYL